MAAASESFSLATSNGKDTILQLIPSKIAEGAMGILHKARNMATQQEVILKGTKYNAQIGLQCHPYEHRWSQWDPTLIQEAYVLAITKTLDAASHFVALRHVFPVIWPSSGETVTVHPPQTINDEEIKGEKGRESEKLQLVLDFVPGGDLYDWIEDFQLRPTRVKGQRVVSIIKDVAKALSSLHQRGWAHRDLKPENLLLDNTGHVYVCDFGFSRPHNTCRLSAGTVEYHSPELWKDNRQGGPSDMWALGLIIHRILRRSDPHYFDKMVRFHNLASGPFTVAPKTLCAAGSIPDHEQHNQRFLIARLVRELHCSLFCATDWKLDAMAFRQFCAIQCIPPSDIPLLWYTYSGCLQTDVDRRWTAEDVLNVLERRVPLPTPTLSLSSKPVSSVRFRRPGFHFLRHGPPKLIEKSPVPPSPRLSQGQAALVPPLLPRSPLLYNARCQGIVHEFAKLLASSITWTEPNAVLVFQSTLEIFICLLSHSSSLFQELDEFTLAQQKMTAIHLVQAIVLDDPTASSRLGLSSLITQLFANVNPFSGAAAEARTRLAISDMEVVWLCHVLSQSVS